MPNWCANDVTLVGKPERIRKLADAFAAGKFCAAVIPIPECLTREGSSSHGGTDAEEYDRIRAENLELTGFDSWYNFCTSRWGTKWDVGDEHSFELSEDGTELHLNFDSAWSPPTGVYYALEEEGIQVQAHYYEPGMGFVGTYENGNDEYYELSEMSSQDVIDTIPEEIDGRWGISESLADIEEEQRMDDDLYRWTKEGGEKLGLISK